MLLRELQSMLAGLYDAPAEHDVHDFLITDAAHAAALQGAVDGPATDEQLLVAEDEEGLGLSLYLDRAVLERLLARFCRRLEERFLRRRQARSEAMVAQLRAFYRLGRHAKLRHAESWR